MKRTDDFLADLEVQLVHAAAARFRPRRRAFPLRPLLTGAAWATALTAIVIAVAGVQREVEQPVSPVPGSGGLLTLPGVVPITECMAFGDVPRVTPELAAALRVLRSRRRTVDDFGLLPVTDQSTTLCDPAPKITPPGVCLMHLEGSYCWTLETIKAGRAVATTGKGERPIVFGLMPDGVSSVRLQSPEAEGEIAVVHNVFWIELQGAHEGAKVAVTPRPPVSGCHDLTSVEQAEDPCPGRSFRRRAVASAG